MQSSYLQSTYPVKAYEEEILTYFTEMQGQESRKANMLGFENDLSNEAAELLLDEDAQLVKRQKGSWMDGEFHADMINRVSQSLSLQ